jgi:predicted CopG family antitoxin
MTVNNRYSRTTIAISKETHSELSKIGRKYQSFDDIISGLLKARNIQGGEE